MDRKERIEQFEALISIVEREPSALNELKKLSFSGIPDYPSHLRPLTYLSFLSLPPSPSALLSTYESYVSDFSARLDALPPPSATAPLTKEDKLLIQIRKDVERTFGLLNWFALPVGTGSGVGTTEDESSSKAEDACWKRIKLLDEYDLQLAEELRKKRTESVPEPSSDEKKDADVVKPAPPTLSLLPPSDSLSASPSSTSVQFPPSPTSPAHPPPSFPTSSPTLTTLSRRQSLLRPLLIHSLLNPSLPYTQGHNSVFAVLYYSFSQCPPASTPLGPGEGSVKLERNITPSEAEASAFFAFGRIVGQLSDVLDFSSSPSPLISPSHTRTNSITTPQTGLQATLDRFSSLLNFLDPTIAASLEGKKIYPGLFVHKWLTTLFSTEFSIPDLLAIWDRLFSLYPSISGDSVLQESLSPVLGHSLDVSLALVLLQKQSIVSPFEPFDKVVYRLQNTLLWVNEGGEVRRLIEVAWSIRGRRLGLTPAPGTNGSAPAKEVKGESGGGSWKSWGFTPTKSSTTATPQTPTPTASLLKSSFWSPKPSPTKESQHQRSESTSSLLTDKRSSIVSATGSDTSTSTSSLFSNFVSSRSAFGNFVMAPDGGIRKAPSSQNPVVIEGHVLPPPPEEIDEREHTLQPNLPPPPYALDENERVIEEEEDEEETGRVEAYEVPDEDDESFSGEEDERNEMYDSDDPELDEQGPSLGERWEGLKKRVGESDAAARVAKVGTNLAVRASLGAERLNQSETAQSISLRTSQIRSQTSAYLRKENLARIVHAASGSSSLDPSSDSGGGLAGGLLKRSGTVVSEPFAPPSFAGGRPTSWVEPPLPSRRPVSPSPHQYRPFSPPYSPSQTFEREIASPTNSVDMSRTSSSSASGSHNGPKPLLLSSSARPAVESPPESRRESSAGLHSPTPNRSPTFGRTGPVLRSDAPVAPLGHARAASAVVGVSGPPVGLGLASGEKRPNPTRPGMPTSPKMRFDSLPQSVEQEEIRSYRDRGVLAASVGPSSSTPSHLQHSQHQSLSSSQPASSSPFFNPPPVAEEAPATQSRLRRSVQRKETSSSISSTTSATAVPAPNGRGWSLSDAPVGVAKHPTPLDTAFAQEPGVISSPVAEEIEEPRPSSPRKERGHGRLPSEIALPFSPVEEGDSEVLSRNSSGGSGVAGGGGGVTRSKVLRRAPGVAPGERKKRTGSRAETGSISSMADLDAEKRRSVSAFLAGEDDGKSVASGGSLRRAGGGGSTRRRERSTVEAGGAASPRIVREEDEYNWDDAADIMAAYGGE